MAKNFPYFKFIATEWLTGDIVYENFDVQGLFINICALYWQRDGKLSIEDITKRYKNEDLINSLSTRFFSVNDGFISIGFLDEQLIDANHISKINSENGKKGAEKRKQLAMAKRPLSEQEANFSKEKKNKRKEEEKEVNIVDGFLGWYNSMQLKYKGKEGKFKKLNSTDLNNLKQLKQLNYSNTDWEHAYLMMLNNDWVKENGTDTPTHFLRNDNFARYLNQQPKQLAKSEDQIRYEHVMKQMQLNK
jgi:hypothetical protein